LSYADDITALCRNKEGIQHIIDEYKNFSRYSGIKLNVEKTEILVLGKENENKEIFKIKNGVESINITESEKVTICGITFSNCQETAYKMNITDKINKLVRQLNIWRQRNLTLSGKILIVKTFGLSQMIYSLQATVIKKEDIRKIEDIVFRFIWNVKPGNLRCIGKINRNLLKQERSVGGINAPDIGNIDKAIKIKHLMRCLSSKHPLAIMVRNELDRVGFSLNNLNRCKNSKSSYINCCIESNKALQVKLINDAKLMSDERDGINKYYYQLFQNVELKDAIFFDIPLNNAIHRVRSKGITTLGQLKTEFENKSNRTVIMDCHQLYTKVPVEIRKLMSLTSRTYPINKEMFCFALNKWKPLKAIAQRDIYSRLTHNHGINVIDYLTNRHKEPVGNKDSFININRMSKSKYLQNVQYKILHNIYPTSKHLFRWKLKDNPDCGHCKNEESLKHAIYECEIASETINNFINLIRESTGRILNLSYQDILLGTSSNRQIVCMNLGEKLLIDEAIIIIKKTLILQRDSKRVVTTDNLKTILKELNSLYKYNGWKMWHWRSLFGENLFL